MTARRAVGGAPCALRKLLTVLLVLAAGAAPAGPRTVTVTLAGRATQVDVTDPASAGQGSVPGAVVLVHGFTRSRANMAGHAADLARAGYRVVVPDLPFLLDSRDNARALRDLLVLARRGSLGPGLDPIVLVGFSAGGLSALLAADAPGVVGYLGLDPFDRPGGVGLDAARRLQRPAYLLRGPSSACNAYSIAEPWVTAFPALVTDRRLPGASHCDFESPTDSLCQFVCGSTDPQRQAVVRDFLRNAVRELLPPPPVTGSR